jgi:transcriptional regulator with XRE-family HTH domain
MSTRASDILKEITGSALTFGRAIAAIRKCENMSQAEMARLLKVSRQYLCDIENERTFVSSKQAAHFAKILGYSEKQFVKLALQDSIERDGLHFMVTIHEYPHTKNYVKRAAGTTG